MRLQQPKKNNSTAMSHLVWQETRIMFLLLLPPQLLYQLRMRRSILMMLIPLLEWLVQQHRILTTDQHYHDKVEVVTEYYPVAPYPAGLDTAMPDYHVDETVNTMAAYPIDESYPADDDVAYPVIDTYPQ
jgi:hypothetical protein